MPLLILLHGFLGQARDYAFLLFLKKYFRLLLCDFSGNVLPPSNILKGTIVYHCREHCFKNLTAEILSTIKKYNSNQQKVFAIGYSLGGRLLLGLLAKEPFLFQKIILESAGLGYATAQEKEARIKEEQIILQKWQKQNFNSFLTEWYAAPLFSSLQAQSTLKQTLINKHRLSSSAKIKYLQNIFSGCSPNSHSYFLPPLKKFSQIYRYKNRDPKKILYLAGALDPKYCAIAAKIAREIPQAQVKIIADCGHHIKKENPLAYQKVIVPFLLAHFSAST